MANVSNSSCSIYSAVTVVIVATCAFVSMFTVLTPVVLTMSMSPIPLQVGDAINLTCAALGGPRLMLSWLKDGTEIVSGKMGVDVLNFTLNTTDDCGFGNYTCIATIDDMHEFSTVLVVPKGKLMYCS